MSVQNMKSNMEEAKTLIKSAVSCIAYIREFFDEDVFTASKYQGMSLRLLERGVAAQSDRLLDWLEYGCFDALDKQYLETLTLEIYDDPGTPNKPLETYKFTIEYPSSTIHQKVIDIRKQNKKQEASTSISLKTNNGVDRIIGCEGALKESFSSQIIRVLRSLCVVMQTLAPISGKKFVSLQITYYDEITPKEYEPPGFHPCVWDSKFLFERPTYKHDFGIVQSSTHRVQIDLETLYGQPPEISKDIVPALEIAQDGEENKPPHGGIEQAQVPAKAVPVKRDPGYIIQETQDSLTTAELNQPPPEPGQEEPSIRINCMCGDNQTDLDMIQCDNCQNWLHTPCAGFCTNRDKRIPEKFICYNCEFRSNKKLLKALQDLASFRRSISVVYAEGLQSITWFSKRLDCGVAKASKLIRRLETEGLILKPNSQARNWSYTVIKSPEAKEKIRFYFSLDLHVFPELAPFLKNFKCKTSENAKGPVQDQVVAAKIESPKKRLKSPMKMSILNKRRRSMTCEAVTCA